MRIATGGAAINLSGSSIGLWYGPIDSGGGNINVTSTSVNALEADGGNLVAGTGDVADRSLVTSRVPMPKPPLLLVERAKQILRRSARRAPSSIPRTGSCSAACTSAT